MKDPRNSAPPMAPHVRNAIDRNVAGKAAQPKTAPQPGGVRPVAPHVQQAIQAHAPVQPANRSVQAKPAAVAQARFYELTNEGKLVFRWWPMTLRTAGWKKHIDLSTGKQAMKDGYGIWEYTVAKKTKAPSCPTPAFKPINNSLRVGRRTAFFDSAPAKHAVFEVNGVVYGLAGDFNAVGLAPDTSKSSVFTWVDKVVYITTGEATEFFDTARTSAEHLWYDLVRQNCYTPVTSALTKLRDSVQDGQLRKDLGLMLSSLETDNYGSLGVVIDVDDSNFVKTVKKHV